MAKPENPRAFLRSKLGAAGFAKFEEGMRLAARDRRQKTPKADVEGQTPICDATCSSRCQGNNFLSAGSYCSLDAF
ncbi:MAG TPA: hypothetical protein VNE39_27355 [Planctomycetota bacterium]|nr:hypothetical protein [Planctomycetota bacterium]